MFRKNIAVIGSGISGLSASWLLAKGHRVCLFEADRRFGGHAHTATFGVGAETVPVDVGFIVFNAATYPNFVQLMNTLGVEWHATEMSFSVSLQDGAVEYSGGSLMQLLGSVSCALTPSHWAMLADIVRFYRGSLAMSRDIDEEMSLGSFLEKFRFGRAFIDRHLLPMAAAIWSSRPEKILDHPARAFIEFFDNHQLLNLGARAKWRSIRGGSTQYVSRMLSTGIEQRRGEAVVSVRRERDGVTLLCENGHSERFDEVVIATHADQALSLLERPTDKELALLAPFRYSDNSVTVHRDERLMPRRRRHWASWNYVGGATAKCGVTYWMNRLQDIATNTNYFVSLNACREPDPALTDLRFACTHPIFNSATLTAQKALWHLQGEQHTWFCGAYFGAGFHEDGVQSGLAVAEQLGGLKRPWTVARPSGRIYLHPDPPETQLLAAAE